MPSAPHRVLLAEPRGDCAGVHRAVETVERTLRVHGAPVYVRGQIMHDEHAVRELEGKGVRFVDSEEEVPTGAVCVFPAHGTTPQVRDNARRRELTVIDVTCPLVAEAHHEAVLHERFPGPAGSAGAGNHRAGRNRRNAVQVIAGRSDLVLVVGSADCGSSQRLVEVARAVGTDARLLPAPDLLTSAWLEGVSTVGLTAGASAPEEQVERVLRRLAELGFPDVETEATATHAVRPGRPGRSRGSNRAVEPGESNEAGEWGMPQQLKRSEGPGQSDASGPPRQPEQSGATGSSGRRVEAVLEHGGADGETCGKLLDRVDRRLAELLSAEETRWSAVDARVAVPVAVVSELIAAGGKRLRPLFCVTGYLASGAAADEDMVVDAAAALELLHAFALIHDDIMDNSPTRRGAPTVHAAYTDLHARRAWAGESRRYGEAVAILAGDLALSYANRLAGRLTGPAARVWHELVTEVIIGQQLDIALAAELEPDPDLARWVAVCKSGRYTIHRPLALGAAIAGRPGLHAAFEAYGVAAGEAFQLRDDLLDAFGDATVTGKPTGLDLSEHKMTLLIALATAKDPRVARLVEDSRHADWNPAELRAALLASGVRADVEERIDALVADARAALADAGLPHHWRLRLEDLADMVAYRDR
ncbi:polyprenyl synthetase family protein [Streptomyces griseus]|uniref:polyprenyl synthetase family protein n=1 Tax=Streptomyces griseus TaxID=1911 RepID=UPI00099B5C76|nr:polyprenyl synthetase family protein [Streptomyces griseus]